MESKNIVSQRDEIGADQIILADETPKFDYSTLSESLRRLNAQYDPESLDYNPYADFFRRLQEQGGFEAFKDLIRD